MTKKMTTNKITEQEYLNAIKIINEYSEQLHNHNKEVQITIRSLKRVSELTDYDRCQISTRLYNVIKWDFKEIRLCDITKDGFFKVRNAGKGSWNELCELTNKIYLKIK
jgi:hypothetical protein